MISIIIFSIKICLLVSIVNISLGTLIGVLLSQKQSIVYKIVETLIALPLVFPPIALGFFLLIIFGKNGVIGKGLNSMFNISIIFSPIGVFFAAVISGFPLMVKSVTSSACVLDKSMIEASTLVGASKMQILKYIILPNISQGIICGLTLSIARSLGEVGMTLMLGGNVTGKTETISLAIYNSVFEGDFQKAAKLSLLLALVASVIFLIIHNYDKGEN